MQDLILIDLFKKIDFSISIEDMLYFQTARAQKPVVSRSKNKVFLTIELDDFLPVRILKELHDKCKNNGIMDIKIILQVKNAKLSKQIILDYIEFIKNNKAQFKGGSWLFINEQDLELNIDDQTITFNVTSHSLKKSLEEQLDYLLVKLEQFGIGKITSIVNVNEISEEQIKKEEEVYSQRVQAEIAKYETVNTTESITIQSKSSWKNSNSLDKPNYKKIFDLENDAQNVVLHGQLILKNIRASKTGRSIYQLVITDATSTIAATFFAKSDQRNILDDLTEDDLQSPEFEVLKANHIQIGDWMSIQGRFSYSAFERDYIFYIDNFAKIDKKIALKTDPHPVKRVELHTHSKMSVMDGISTVGEYIQLANQFNWKAIALTDHLNVQAFPDAYAALKSINKKRQSDNQLKLIYGVELNVIDRTSLWYVKNPQNHDLRSSKFVIFDLETTGLSPEMDEIIEFGAIIYDAKSANRQSIDILIKQKEPLKQFTKELTNITDDMLADKPDIERAFKEIYKIIDGAILVAHNANFDFNFLNSYALKLGYPPLTNTIIDTLAISRVVMPKLKNHRLGTISKKLGIMYDESVAHRADYDADVLSDVYDKLILAIRQEHEVNIDTDLNKIEPINDKENQNLTRVRGFHTNVLAKNQAGLKEIYKLVSISHTTTFLGNPKIFDDHLVQVRKNNNILVGAGCVNSEIFEFARTNTDETLRNALKKYDYIEIQPISVYKHLLQNGSLNQKQLELIIRKIIKLAKEEGVKIVATSDAHYTFENLKLIREILINSKGLGGSSHPLYDFKKRVMDYPNQHVRTTTEMLEEFMWLEDHQLIEEIVINNTNWVAEQVDENIKPIKDGLYTPIIENVDNLLREKCYETAHNLYGANLPNIVSKRLEKELSSIIKHGFAVIYWISHLLVQESYRDGYLVGSRGSVGSSFVATMSKITEVNPLKAHYRCEKCLYSDFDTLLEFKCGYDLPKQKCPSCQTDLTGDGHDIPFETFLGFDGDKVPDIDLNFSGEYQASAHNFIKEMFGEENCFRAGTISTVAAKTAFGYTKKYYESLPLEQQPRKVEIDRQASLIEGVKRTTGQHPGGIIILPKGYEIEDFTPVNYPANDMDSSWKTTHFDFHSIHDNLLKMDILGHVDPTALRMLADMTGVDPLTIPTNDERVYNLFSGLEELNLTANDINGETTGTIGIPEFGTGFVRNMLKETKPKTFADLVQISGLSHGTDVWVGNARDLINQGIANISSVIGCRDDIMVYLMSMGLDKTLAFTIMESVRKGKGLKKDWIATMREKLVPDWYIESCQKIKYMFPKAHATAYVLMAYRVAWYKIYYPAEYYATFLSTRIDVFELKETLQGYDKCLARLKDIQYRRQHKIDISKKELDLEVVYEILIEMFKRNIDFENVNFEKSQGLNFIVEKDEAGHQTIIPPFNVIDSLGETVAQSIINARNNAPITSVNDLRNRTQVNNSHIKLFEELNIFDSFASESQLSFEF